MFVMLIIGRGSGNWQPDRHPFCLLRPCCGRVCIWPWRSKMGSPTKATPPGQQQLRAQRQRNRSDYKDLFTRWSWFDESTT